MRFEVEKKPLMAALKMTSRAMPGNNHIPIMACVKISADAGLAIRGAGFDMQVSVRCEASVSEPGEACVNAQALAGVVSAVAAGAIISVETHAKGLRVTAGRLKADLATMPAAEFMADREAVEMQPVECSADDLAAAATFGANEEARPYLRGVVVDGDKIAATNGHFLGAFDCKTDLAEMPIVPLPAIPLIVDALKAGGQFFAGVRAWRCEAPTFSACGGCVDGDYPAWRRIAVTDAPMVAHADADAIAEAVRALMSAGAETCVIAAGDDEIALSGERFRGDHVSSMSVPVSAETAQPMRAEVNAKYLLGATSALSGEVVELSARDGTICLKGARGFAIVLIMRNPANQMPGSAVAA